MSTVEKMQVSGIRSFSQDTQEMIIFYKPLTLIVGKNGCGKTTTIEALKYACTGDHPPNTGRGASFVHDPKVEGVSEVSGQIKLQVRDVKGKAFVVTRNVKVTQKNNGTLSFAQQENNIQRMDPDDPTKKICVSNKCADINKWVPDHMGVSKAVLDNVIFCHQEDSNWPLGEPKDLKKRFDDIFDSARYTKALEAIQKKKKTQREASKLLDEEMKRHEQTKDSRDRILKEIANDEKKLASKTHETEACKSKLREVKRNMDSLEKEQEELLSIDHECMRLSERVSVNIHALEEHKSQIKELYDGTEEGLEEEHRAYLDLLGGVDKEILQRESEKKQLHAELAAKKQQIDAKRQVIAEKRAQQKDLEEKIAQRSRDLDALVNFYGLEEPYEGLEGDDAYSFLEKQLQLKRENQKSDLKSLKERNRALLQDHQKRVNEATLDVEKLKNQIDADKARIRETEGKIASTERELSVLGFGTDEVTSLKEELDLSVLELHEFEQANELKALQEQHDKISQELPVVKLGISNVENEKKGLSSLSEKESKMNFQRSQAKKREDWARAELAKIEDVLVSHGLDVDPNAGSDAMSKLSESFRKSLSDQQQNLDTTVIEQQMKAQTRDSIKGGLTAKRQQQDDLSANIKELEKKCEKYLQFQEKNNITEAPDVQAKKLMKKRETMQVELARKEAERVVREGYISDAEVSSACPLCDRHFSGDDQKSSFLSQQRQKITSIPEEIETLKKNMSKNERGYAMMQDTIPLYKELTESKNEKLPALNSEIQELEAKLESASKEADQLQKMVEATRDLLNEASSLQSIIGQVSAAHAEAASLRKEAETTHDYLKKTSGGQFSTLKEADAKLDELKSKRDQLEQSERDLDYKIKNSSKKYQYFKDKVADCEKKLLQAEKSTSQRLTLERTAEEMKTSLTGLKEALDAREKNLEPAKTSLGEAQRALDEESKRCHKREADEDEAVSKLVNDVNRVLSRTDGIQRLRVEFNPDELDSANARIDEISREMETCDNRMKDLDEKLSDLRRTKDERESVERNIRDNKKRFQLERDLQALKQEEKEMSEKKSGFRPMQEIQDKLRGMTKEKNNLAQEMAFIEGATTTTRTNIQNRRGELKDPKFEGIDTVFREKKVEQVTAKEAIDDLDKYHNALDKALMMYHQSKMSEINEIITELWRETYQGNDIDTIAIVSDADNETTNRSLRSYNYRVVMKKGEVALDMRGRCSAGQKVLASIVIRMALAETFCLNCGILALDEPTTNLDKANITSLAESLSSIIKQRQSRRQHNFQLICITHDETFVQAMGRGDHADFFWRVSKNEDGFSHYAKERINLLD